jgi:Do/DeqQ family serine protease
MRSSIAGKRAVRGLLTVMTVGAALACGLYARAQDAKVPPVAPLVELQTAFEKLADKVGPSVVVISTLKRVGLSNGGGGLLDRIPEDEYERLFGKRRPRIPEDLRERPVSSAGSGVIIDSSGLILTNQHVVEDAMEIEVGTHNRRRFQAKVVGTDPRSDLAVIKVVKGDLKGLPAAALGDASKVKVGHWAVALGNPFGLAHDGRASMTVGVVSAIGRFLGSRVGGEDRYYGNLIQTDASINPGNSGGPLLNIYGEVIGINTVISTRSGGSEGVGFAIPINSQTREIIAHLAKGEEVQYGYLGVMIKTPTEKECEDAGVPIGYGALVDFLEPGGPGDKAGLKRGDVVVTFQGERVLDSDHLVRLVGATPVGRKVDMVVMRNKARTTVTAEIVRRRLTGAGGGPAPLRGDVEDWRGVVVREITAQDRIRLRIPIGRSGVLIDHIRPNSAGARAAGERARLAAGDVIGELDGKKVRSLAEFRAAIKTARGAVDVLVEGKPPISVAEE